MKFIVSSQKLSRQLQVISGIISGNNQVPILNNFLFRLENGQLSVIASDIETTMKVGIEIEKGEEDGTVAVPGKLLLEMLKAFADQPLTFQIDTTKGAIEISSENGKYKLAGFSGDDFPKLPEEENATAHAIEAEVLHDAISTSLFAVANDTLRPVMSGVYFSLGNGCTAVATDAHKLVRYRHAGKTGDGSSDFIIPAKPLNLVKQILSESEEKVNVSVGEKNAFFALGDVFIACRQIDGKFPDYEAVIPKDNPNVLEIDRLAFLNAVRRICIFSSKTTYQVRLHIAGSELQIAAQDLDFSNEAVERMSCSYHGEDLEIGFNGRFLIEMLLTLKSDQVRLEMSVPNRAGILHPVADEADEDILMLLMPIMLNN